MEINEKPMVFIDSHGAQLVNNRKNMVPNCLGGSRRRRCLSIRFQDTPIPNRESAVANFRLVSSKSLCSSSKFQTQTSKWPQNQRKPMKTNENQWKSMKTNGFHWFPQCAFSLDFRVSTGSHADFGCTPRPRKKYLGHEKFCEQMPCIDLPVAF